MDFRIDVESWPLKEPFRFAGYSIEALDTVCVTLTENGCRGCGEGVMPVVFDVTMDRMVADLERARAAITAGENPWAACAALGAGPARNALDCALWDLRAKATGRSVWEQAGLSSPPARLVVDQTISLAEAGDMGLAAARSGHGVLKVKLDAEDIEARVRAVREARPAAELIVDANQSWTLDILRRCAPVLADLGVAMIEQPLPVGEDKALAGYTSPVPLFADESCHDRTDLERIQRLYQGINIKLDKCGGLSEALAMAVTARARGLGLMVGCMAGTSLSMAPAYVVGTLCRWADLDGPLLLASDREAPMHYQGGALELFTPALWG